MSEIWYKDKNYYSMMKRFHDEAGKIDSEELWNHISEIRSIAEDYNALSLKKAKREARGIDLTEISEKYKSKVNIIETMIKESKN